MADRLDLTTEQRDAIAGINQERRDVIAPLADELRFAESNLRRAIFADSPDPGEVETFSAQVAGSAPGRWPKLACGRALRSRRS